MRIANNVPSNPVRRTSHDTGNLNPSDFVKKHINYKGRGFVIYPTPKTARSFLALAKTFFGGLFRRNPDLRLQRTPPPIFMEIPKLTKDDCERLWQFDYATKHILSEYAKTYIEEEKLFGPELQEFMKAKPAFIANFGKDFVEKFHEIHATASDEKLPMAHMLYQALGAVTLRSNNNSACVKGFARFLQRYETAKAFEDFLGLYTGIPKPEAAAKPTRHSICEELSHADAHAQPELNRQPEPLTATQSIPQISAQAIAAEPNRATYRGFEMESELDTEKTVSFIARAWEGIINQLPVIRGSRYFRPYTKKAKPNDIADLGNVSTAVARRHWEAKVKHAPTIIKRFVQDFDWNYPALWPKLKQCEMDFLKKLISTPVYMVILDLIPQSVAQSPPIGGHDAHTSEFSPGFLTTLRSLESDIDASIYGIQFTRDMTKPELKPASNLEMIEPEPEQTLNPDVAEQEPKLPQIRRWDKAPLTNGQKSALNAGSAQAVGWADSFGIQPPDPQPSNPESPASKPGPYKVFQYLRVKSLNHFMKLAMNDLESIVNPDTFPQAIMQPLENFVNSYIDHFAFRLTQNSIGDPNKYTSADLSNAHAFSMRQAVDAAVLSAVSRKVILPDNAQKYERRLNIMCRQIDFAIMRATGGLKPVVPQH
ncbi:MAG TPA: hypothetical protein VGM52_01600 [Herbaspirillum sp.]|jgi:hypothetical protein